MSLLVRLTHPETPGRQCRRKAAARGSTPTPCPQFQRKLKITRFKGLGEISAGEFKDFIGENIRLDPVNLHHLTSSDELLSFFMGKNTPERQEFIIENLRVEKDLVEV